jgi:Na+/proline symporter
MNDMEPNQLLHDSLSEEDRDLLRKLSKDPSVLDLIGDTFRGRNRWLTIYATIWILIFFAGAIFCLVRFFSAETDSLKEVVGWAAGTILCMIMVGLLKLWFWLEMHRNSLLREIKRLELAVATIPLPESAIGENR